MGKKVFLVVAVCLSLFSCKSNKPYTDKMKIELLKMYKIDQGIQKEIFKNIGNKKQTDSLETRMREIFITNQITIKEYFKKYGIPTISKDGKNESFYFWLIVQHSDNDIKFQEKVLRKMKRFVKNNDINKSNYAYLYDRVKKNKNRPQRYGTQMVYDTTGRHFPYKLENEKKINQYRSEMGLEPIEDYLNKMNSLN